MTRLRWRTVLIAVGACAFSVLAVPAKTKIVESEGKKVPGEAPPRKILVLVVASDSKVRATFEEVIAGELSLRGATAIASNVAFPELPKERGPFEAKLVADGFDAVTVSRLVSRDDKLEWKEGHESYRSDYQGMDCWGGYWYTYQQVFVPGYLEKETTVRARTDLWRTSGAQGSKGRLVWSGTSQTLDPTTAPQAAREVGAAVAKALAKAKLI
jgi:hypothetical protein